MNENDEGTMAAQPETVDEHSLAAELARLIDEQQKFQQFIANQDAERQQIIERLSAARKAKDAAVSRAILEPTPEHDAEVDRAQDALAAVYADEARFLAKVEHAQASVEDLGRQIAATRSRLRQSQRRQLQPMAEAELPRVLDKLIPLLAELSVLVAAKLGDPSQIGRQDLGVMLRNHIDKEKLSAEFGKARKKYRQQYDLGELL